MWRNQVFTNNSAKNVEIAKHQQYVQGYLMTKLLWKFGQNLFIICRRRCAQKKSFMPNCMQENLVNKIYFVPRYFSIEPYLFISGKKDKFCGPFCIHINKTDCKNNFNENYTHNLNREKGGTRALDAVTNLICQRPSFFLKFFS